MTLELVCLVLTVYMTIALPLNREAPRSVALKSIFAHCKQHSQVNYYQKGLFLYLPGFLDLVMASATSLRPTQTSGSLETGSFSHLLISSGNLSPKTSTKNLHLFQVSKNKKPKISPRRTIQTDVFLCAALGAKTQVLCVVGETACSFFLLIAPLLALPSFAARASLSLPCK